MIAACFVDPDGAYAGIADVDVWDRKRDARRYKGPWPAVLHPPCERWCRFAKGIETRFGYRVGDDDRCFENALRIIHDYGGVLEHPAHSLAWDRFELPRPAREGWTTNLFSQGYSCYIEQGRYGHPMRKATWLYAVGVDLPELRWGLTADQDCLGEFKWGSRHYKPAHDRDRPRIDRMHSVTTSEFRDVLLEMARSAL